MLSEMTARQFQEWLVYSQLEPWDETRADQRAGSVVQAIYNSQRGKGQPRAKLDDCTLKFGEQPKMTWQEMKAFAKAETEKDKRKVSRRVKQSKVPARRKK